MVRDNSNVFLITLSVDSDISAGTDLLGKSVSDLQSGITIGSDAITGTLKYVTGYTGFSGDVSEQSGNYIALHCESAGADKITVELINGTVGHPVELDDDGLIVIRITDKATQKIKVVAYEGERTVEKVYGLTGLTLNNA